MEARINEQLKAIADDRNLRILLACETGSRAWGFPSLDSDYDVRIVYVHERDWYISLNERKDSLELMLDDGELDITGWELRKSLRLLWKSNPPLLERIQSPIIYKSNAEFLAGIKPLAARCYSPIATMHHYLSMALKFREAMAGQEEGKLKGFFYALRTTLACKWIMEQDSPPPIEFGLMLHGLGIRSGLIERVDQLIELKSGKTEAYIHPMDKELLSLMNDVLATAEQKAKTLPAAKADMKELDAFFREMVR